MAYKIALLILLLLLPTVVSATSEVEYMGSFRQGSTVPVVLVVSSAPTTATGTFRAADGTSLATVDLTRVGSTVLYLGEYLADDTLGVVLVELADAGSGASVFTFFRVVRPGELDARKQDVDFAADRLLRLQPQGGRTK